MSERHQFPDYASCEHCKHQPYMAGCLSLVVGVVLVAIALWVFLTNYRWTSIENGCVVERRFTASLFDTNDPTSSVVDRVCVSDG